MYNSERNNLLEGIKVLFPHIVTYSQDDLFNWLMSNVNENVIIMLAKYVHLSFQKRNNNRIITSAQL